MGEERKVGQNFDADMADSIFDKLKNVEGKIKPKREGKFDNITYMMDEAKLLEKSGKLDEAIKLYKEVIVILPDSTKAYEAIANIYKSQGETENDLGRPPGVRAQTLQPDRDEPHLPGIHGQRGRLV